MLKLISIWYDNTLVKDAYV